MRAPAPDDDLIGGADDITSLGGRETDLIGDDDLIGKEDDDGMGKRKPFTETIVEKLTTAQEQFRKARIREREQRDTLNDPEFWFCIYFPTRELKNEFLAKSGITEHIGGDKYIDGIELARAMGIKMSGDRVPFTPVIGVKSRWANLALPLPTPKKTRS